MQPNPPFLGFATRYWSWRTLEFAILAADIIVLALLYYVLPETSHSVTHDSDKVRELCSPAGHRGFWTLNPLQSLGLLKRPNLLLVVSKPLVDACIPSDVFNRPWHRPSAPCRVTSS